MGDTDEQGRRKQVEDDAKEDLELKDEDADQIRGGVPKAGKIDLEKTKIDAMKVEG